MNVRPSVLDQRFAQLDDGAIIELDRKNREAVLADPAEAKRLYDKHLQTELAWRSRSAPDRATPLLMLTVGAQAESPTNAALAWRAERVVLLHTHDERGPAEATYAAVAQTGAHVTRVLIGDGFDLPALYRALERAWADAGRPSGAVVDITGGLKTMSAAALAGGFFIPGCRVVYLQTDQVRPGAPPYHFGTFWFSTRVLHLADPLTVFGVVERQRAGDLLRAHAYAAAAFVYEDLARRVRRRPDAWRADLAQGLAKADAMDLAGAAACLSSVLASISAEVRDDPSLREDPLASLEAQTWLTHRRDGLSAVRDVVGAAGSAVDPTRTAHALAMPGFLDFIAMLLALAQRRIDEGAFDLAALYAYRAIEAVPQRRLVARGYDPGAMDWERLFAEGSTATGEPPDTLKARLLRATGQPEGAALRPTVDRNFGYAILGEVLRDPVVPRTLLDRVHKVTAARNHSLLAHGATAIKKSAAKEQLKVAEQRFDALCRAEGIEPDAVRVRHAPPPASILAST